MANFLDITLFLFFTEKQKKTLEVKVKAEDDDISEKRDTEAVDDGETPIKAETEFEAAAPNRNKQARLIVRNLSFKVLFLT